MEAIDFAHPFDLRQCQEYQSVIGDNNFCLGSAADAAFDKTAGKMATGAMNTFATAIGE